MQLSDTEHQTQRTGDMNSTTDERLLAVRHGFEVAGYHFLLPKGMFSEVTHRTAICAIPDTPSSFLGFINHRGETVPVFSVQRVLDEDAEANGRWVLLLDQTPRTVGILLDAYPKGISGVDQHEAEAIKDAELKAFCRSCYSHEGAIWYEFDHRRFCEHVRKSFQISAPV